MSSTLHGKVKSHAECLGFLHTSAASCYYGFLPMQALLEALAPGDESYALALALDPARLPVHIAIIMDGNGRWARRRNLPRVAGHKAGVNAVRTTVETCGQLGPGGPGPYACFLWRWGH